MLGICLGGRRFAANESNLERTLGRLPVLLAQNRGTTVMGPDERVLELAIEERARVMLEDRIDSAHEVIIGAVVGGHRKAVRLWHGRRGVHVRKHVCAPEGIDGLLGVPDQKQAIRERFVP